jgi:hypothetical protein
MGGYRAGKSSWVDPGFYPVEERLGRGMKEGTDEALLVDVGGGLGHDLKLLKEKHEHLPGRLILQDKEEVLSEIPTTNNVFEKMTHDFFTRQPVQGLSPSRPNCRRLCSHESRCACVPPAFRSPRLG